jgi:hypothetical protein
MVIRTQLHLLRPDRISFPEDMRHVHGIRVVVGKVMNLEKILFWFSNAIPIASWLGLDTSRIGIFRDCNSNSSSYNIGFCQTQSDVQSQSVRNT